MENIEAYKQLAERNGWSYSLSDNRPYFMKDGKYAIPDETTSKEDKELLATIISEGSKEMAQLILLCWDNGITISGPCSGIRDFHVEKTFSLHFSFESSKDIIDPIYKDLQEVFPTFNHMYRQKDNNIVRYDIDYILGEKELTTDESDKIFSTIKEQLEIELKNKSSKKNTIV